MTNTLEPQQAQRGRMIVFVTDYDLSKLGYEWGNLVEAARGILDSHDRNRWALGWIGGRIVRTYGEDSVAKFVYEVKKVEISTMYGYIRVSAMFKRADVLAFPALYWSHFNQAERMKDKRKAMAVLRLAEREDWFVEDLREHINALLGRPAGLKKKTEFSMTARQMIETGLLTEEAAAAAKIDLDEQVTLRVYQSRQKARIA